MIPPGFGLSFAVIGVLGLVTFLFGVPQKRIRDKTAEDAPYGWLVALTAFMYILLTVVGITTFLGEHALDRIATIVLAVVFVITAALYRAYKY